MRQKVRGLTVNFMPKNNVDKNKIIAVDIKDDTNILIFNNRMEASSFGFNTSKIGLSLKNYKYSYKNYFWFYEKDFKIENFKSRLKLYNIKLRKKYCILYKKCIKCNENKKWTDFGINSKKTDRNNRCRNCDSKKSTNYAKRNREKINERRKKYFKNNLFKLRITLSNRLNSCIRLFFKKRKKDSSLKYLGCTLEFLTQHLESKFKEGMNWNNYGLYGWHIDHIVPLSSAKSEEDLYKLCHYTNLQPLWAKENLSKNNKF